MNKIFRYTGLCVLFMALLMGSFVTQPTQAASRDYRPVNLVAPRGDEPLFNWLKSSMISVLFGMKDGNFSAGDVLYSEFTTHNNYPQIMGRIVQNSSLSVDLTTFSSQLASYLATHPKIGLTATTILQNLQMQIGSNTQLNINKYTSIAPLKDVNMTSHFVVVLYDPDKSVINAMNDIRANKTLTSQPFTGDEVLTTVRMDKTVESIYGQYVTKNVIKYGNGVDATAFVEFGIFMNNHPFIAHQILQGLNLGSDTTLSSIRDFVSTNSSLDRTVTNLHPMRNVNLGFTVSQLQINGLTLAKNKQGNVLLKDFNATLVENHALGITIYNDTNNNGIMDLSMRTVNSTRPGLNGTVLPNGSDEALYRVDFKNAQSSSYVPVAKSTVNGNDELSFSINAQNVNVVLNPVSQNLDNSIFENDTSLDQTISNFGYTFHFMPNATADTVNVKFDYNLGTWSNTTMLKGLSLNQMFLTGITDFSGRHRVMSLDQGNKTVNTDQTATRAGKFVVNAGQAPIAQVDLDQIPYTVGGTTQEQAYGQTLPLLFASYLFGRITTNGEILQTIGGSATSARYLYSLSYPVFGGQSISHDPTFAMVASTGSSSSNNQQTGVPGFELLSILALPVLYYIKKRK